MGKKDELPKYSAYARAMAPHFAEVGLKYEITDFSAPDGKCEEVISKIK